MGGGQFPVTKQEMATKFVAGEVLVLMTEDDYSGRSNSDNRESIDGAIHAYCGKTRLSTVGWEDVRAVIGNGIPGPEGSLGLLRVNYRKKISNHLCRSTRRISWIAEGELQEEDKQSFVPKAILLGS